jgi:hypothetical protein
MKLTVRRKAQIVLGLFLLFNQSSAFATKPKYGPEQDPYATPLWSSHEYFQNSHPSSTQFWSLISFYIPQFTGASCSVASITMVLNAARTRLKQTSEDPVISESALLESVHQEHWKERTTTKDGYQGKHGVPLGLLAGLAQEAFQKHGLPHVTVLTMPINDASVSTKQRLIQDLKEFEQNPNFYIIANFDQKAFTDDMEVGHIAPIGAYDSKNEKVLILDPDREYFSPYWVSLDTLLRGMHTMDSDAKSQAHRGYITIQIQKP